MVPQDRDLREVPQAKVRRVAQPLAEYAEEHPNRDRAIAAAYVGGGYTLQEIGDYFGLHYSRVSKVVRTACEPSADAKGRIRSAGGPIPSLELTALP